MNKKLLDEGFLYANGQLNDVVRFLPPFTSGFHSLYGNTGSTSFLWRLIPVLLGPLSLVYHAFLLQGLQLVDWLEDKKYAVTSCYGETIQHSHVTESRLTHGR